MIPDPQQLSVILYPDPILRQVAKPIPQVDDHIRAIARRMIELMHEHEGVGLAGPQVGLPLRIFVANPHREGDVDTVYINPVLTEADGKPEPYDEGCLSIPRVTVSVARPPIITITALDIEGREFSKSADDLEARIWQHETDHLDGKLILDKMSPIDRMANRKQIKKLEAQYTG